MKDIETYAMEEKWNGITRYKCPKCHFDSIDVPDFKSHLKQHGPKLIPTSDTMALKINETEPNIEVIDNDELSS